VTDREKIEDRVKRKTHAQKPERGAPASILGELCPGHPASSYICFLPGISKISSFSRRF
jgi:hypothetical protein